MSCVHGELGAVQLTVATGSTGRGGLESVRHPVRTSGRETKGKKRDPSSIKTKSRKAKSAE